MFCTLCNKTLALSTAGRSALIDHANARKYSEAVKKNTQFFYCCMATDSIIASSSSAQEGKQNAESTST